MGRSTHVVAGRPDRIVHPQPVLLADTSVSSDDLFLGSIEHMDDIIENKDVFNHPDLLRRASTGEPF